MDSILETWICTPNSGTALDLLDRVSTRASCTFYGGPETEWLIQGEDPLVLFQGLDVQPYEFLRRGELPPILPDLMGFVSYECGYELDAVLPQPKSAPFPWPTSQWALYRKMTLLHLPTGRCYEALREGSREIEQGPLQGQGEFQAQWMATSDEQKSYEAKIEHIRECIARGEVYQVNLTRQELWSWTGKLQHFARRLFQVNPAPYSAWLQQENLGIVSSSPELFLRWKEGRIVSRPIKGTAPRGRTEQEDQEHAAKLQACPKNRSELAMIVDLIRNDLTRICRLPSVTLEAFPVLESFANVHHLVATVSGQLRVDIRFRNLMEALFPGGSITGCPKLAAMQLIHQLEAWPRGIYTGALGWMAHDLSQGCLNLPIRTVQAIPGQLSFGVGGGIVWDSDPRLEWEETQHKARSIIQCLN